MLMAATLGASALGQLLKVRESGQELDWTKSSLVIETIPISWRLAQFHSAGDPRRNEPVILTKFSLLFTLRREDAVEWTSRFVNGWRAQSVLTAEFEEYIAAARAVK